MIRSLVRKTCRRIVAIGTAAQEEWRYEHNEHVLQFTRCLEFAAANGVEGDVLEFGVSTGDTLVILECLIERILRRKYGMRCRLFGFDSFEGLPEPRGKDRDTHVGELLTSLKFNKGMYKSTKEEVWSRLKQAEEVDTENISLISGWYNETLTSKLKKELVLGHASMINIDCDFYESTVDILKWCEPLMRQGTIINFDDWFCYEGRSDRGEQLAFHEFLEQHPKISATPFSTYSWHGKAFIINRNHD